jgi:hypothetical protein
MINDMRLKLFLFPFLLLTFALQLSAQNVSVNGLVIDELAVAEPARPGGEVSGHFYPHLD